jgi:hypothetical protein
MAGCDERPRISVCLKDRKYRARCLFLSCARALNRFAIVEAAGLSGTALTRVEIVDSGVSRRHPILHPAAPPLGSLTPADAPLIDAEILFRQPEPPLLQPVSPWRALVEQV